MEVGPHSPGLVYLQESRRHQRCQCTEKRPHENTGRRRASTSQRERPHEKPVLPRPQSQTSRPQNCEKVSFCSLSQPVRSVLVWQPEQTNVTSALANSPAFRAILPFNSENNDRKQTNKHTNSPESHSMGCGGLVVPGSYLPYCPYYVFENSLSNGFMFH